MTYDSKNPLLWEIATEAYTYAGQLGLARSSYKKLLQLTPSTDRKNHSHWESKIQAQENKEKQLAQKMLGIKNPEPSEESDPKLAREHSQVEIEEILVFDDEYEESKKSSFSKMLYYSKKAFRFIKKGLFCSRGE